VYRTARFLGLSILCLLGLVQAAGAASWSAQTMVTPQAPNGNLLSVSCTGTTACTAVGANVDSAGRLVTLGEQWSPASGWAIKPTPGVAGTSTNNQLDAVSCSAANDCIAIGSSTGSAYSTRWTGTAWSTTPTTITPPSGSYGVTLNGVSCTASNACEAVGSYFDSVSSKTLPLFEFWNGSTWTKQSLATPQPTSTYAYLNGVSCKLTLCVAAGAWEDSTFHFHPLIERLSAVSAAGVWKQQTTPVMTGAVSSTLNGVSCASATACVAVGSFNGTSGSGAFDERGTMSSTTSAWAAHAVSGAYDLLSVSCSAATACTATDGSSSSVFRLSGSSWTPQATPAPGGTLASVSCTTSVKCTTVGWSGGYAYYGAVRNSAASAASPSTGSSPLATQAAAEQRFPARFTGGSQHLDARQVAAAKAGQATASFLYFGGEGTTLAETWNGSASGGWSIQPTQNRTGAEISRVVSVSCASGSCVSVGSSSTPGSSYGTGLTALTEVRRGTTWSSKPMTPTGHSVSPRAVSCKTLTTTSAWCMTVGSMLNSSSQSTGMSAIWNGSSWNTAQPLALPTNAYSFSLSSVSCSAVNKCIAVGSYYDLSTGKQVVISELWSGGTSWTPKSTAALPSTATSPHLDSISCVSATSCKAVGSYTDSSTFASHALAENLGTTAWSAATVPVPSGTTYSYLDHVSCSAAAACTAVGGRSASTSGALVVRSSGTGGTAWSLQTPPSSSYSPWNSVSCFSSTGCSAIDSYESASWSGSTTWGTTLSPFAASSTGAYPSMLDVTCSAATSCTAVGDGNHWVSTPLAELYS
jgi:hypothetical protein